MGKRWIKEVTLHEAMLSGVLLKGDYKRRKYKKLEERWGRGTVWGSERSWGERVGGWWRVGDGGAANQVQLLCHPRVDPEEKSQFG